jgi:hypothetical protein
MHLRFANSIRTLPAIATLVIISGGASSVVAQETQTAIVGNAEFTIEFVYPVADVRTIANGNVQLLQVSTDDAEILVYDTAGTLILEGEGDLRVRQISTTSGLSQFVAQAVVTDVITGEEYDLKVRGMRPPSGILEVEIILTPVEE